MTAMYIIQVVLLWSLGLLVYRLGFRKLRLFSLSRYFLLILIPLGIVAPLFPNFWSVTSETNVVVWMEELVLGSSGFAVNSVSGSSEPAFDWALWMGMGILVYLAGVLYVVFRTFKSFGKLHSLKRNAEYIDRVEGVKIYAVSFPSSFSFFEKIYVPKSVVEDSKAYRTIVLHELVHVKEKHWVDKVWMFLCCSALWFFPWVYWIRNALEEVHEFSADYGVLKKVEKRYYFQLLLSRQMDVNYPSPLFVSPFFSNNLKNRIGMMATKIKNRTFHCALILFSTLLMWAFSSVDLESRDYHQISESGVFNDSIPEPTLSSSGELIYKVVDQMPRFPGCEDMEGSLEDKKNCADMKMLKWIYENIRYPEEASKEGLTGQVVVGFVVKSTGQMDEINILRDIGGGCGEEVVRVFEEMSREKVWTPGYQEGKAVHVKYLVPVRFALD
nr:M56 family metallopeptidase [Saprospiraceae bacterium]